MIGGKFNLRVEPFLRENVFVASQKVRKRNMQYATAAAAAVALDTHAYMQGRVVLKQRLKKINSPFERSPSTSWWKRDGVNECHAPISPAVVFNRNSTSKLPSPEAYTVRSYQ